MDVCWFGFLMFIAGCHVVLAGLAQSRGMLIMSLAMAGAALIMAGWELLRAASEGD